MQADHPVTQTSSPPPPSLQKWDVWYKVFSAEQLSREQNFSWKNEVAASSATPLDERDR